MNTINPRGHPSDALPEPQVAPIVFVVDHGISVLSGFVQISVTTHKRLPTGFATLIPTHSG
jgi:hypothetical protein